ncbi:MAG: radical SAM protein [Nitrospirae bacterium]|nr:radical SAM protein [Nitrospirota bacterium]
MKNRNYGHIEIPLKRVHIELTNVCNFDCVFCPKSEMKRPYGFMETGLAKRIITELSKEGICEKVTLHVMGEPTLHRNFFEILDHARNENIKVGLTTNGAGLGGKTGKLLLDYDLHQIDVSLQTPDKKSFALRKAGSMSFDDYFKGILDFFSSYTAKKRGTTFKFRFLNTRFRKKSMEEKTGPVRVISSTKELRGIFQDCAGQIYGVLGVNPQDRENAMRRINRLVSYKWNVVEIYPRVFFETYVMDDWVNIFSDKKIHNAWAGYCFGMRDHFSILYNGDVVLCCVDYDGHTALGNLHDSSLRQVLSSDELAKIINGFKRFKVVNQHCKRCLGSNTVSSWMFKPIASIAALKLLKPFFYKHTSLLK